MWEQLGGTGDRFRRSGDGWGDLGSSGKQLGEECRGLGTSSGTIRRLSSSGKTAEVLGHLLGLGSSLC